MKLQLAISPCPNDTYIFEALINGRIGSDGLEFDLHLADIRALNTWAQEGAMDVCKVSYALFPLVQQEYQLLTVGGALGRGVGPLVVSQLKVYPDDTDHITVAIPGANTTANLLFSLAYPRVTNKLEYPFWQIEEAVLANEVDIGVLIHEGRFTYQRKGLRLVRDLGVYWAEQTGLPTPLGALAIRRGLPDELKERVSHLVAQSLNYAMLRPSASYPFVQQHAKSMDDEAMRSQIELYVNEFTKTLGDEGIKAAQELFHRAAQAGISPAICPELPIFSPSG